MDSASQILSEKFGFPLAEEAVWMPVRTIPLNEFRVEKALREKDIPCYLPLVRKLQVRNVRRKGVLYTYKKELRRPMFPSYLFARISMTDRDFLWGTHSVLKILTLSKAEEDAFLNELHGVRLMEKLGEESDLEFAPELQPGDYFVIESGVWAGVYGQLRKKDRLSSWTIYLETLGTTVTTVIDPSKFKFKKVE